MNKPYPTRAGSELLFIVPWCLLAVFQPVAGQEPPIDATGHQNQSGLSFSPDGRQAFWSAWNGPWGSDKRSKSTILTSDFSNGAWSAPREADFSGEHSDDDPFVSPDGQWLYFVSDRPANARDSQSDADIWRVSLWNDGAPEHLSINSDEAEYSPVIVASGALYFASARQGGAGQGDLYRAAPAGADFAPPEALGRALNNATGEWNLWVAPDESEILFEASSRRTNVSTAGDLYYSWRTKAGWVAAIPVSALNTEHSDLLPRISADGRTLYYTVAPINGQARIETTKWPKLAETLRATYAPILLVANRSSHEVSFVDLSSGDVEANVATGAGPHLLSNLSDGLVVATGYGEFPQPHDDPVVERQPFAESINSELTVIDVEQRSVRLTTRLNDCEKPHHSWIVAQRIYVTCESERRIQIVDLATGEHISHLDSRQDGSHVLSYNRAANSLAVTNTGSDSITLLDLDKGEPRVVPLESGSEGLLAVADDFWITNAVAGTVAIVAAGSASLVDRVPDVCGFPIALSAGPHQEVWVACFGTSEIVAIDRKSRSITRRIALDAQPLNILAHPQRDLAYVSMPRENAVAEIDLVAGKQLRRFRVGIEPDGLRWATTR
jgi:hypothetical protein